MVFPCTPGAVDRICQLVRLLCTNIKIYGVQTSVFTVEDLNFGCYGWLGIRVSLPCDHDAYSIKFLESKI